MILKIKKRENPYVQIDKSIVDDPKISWKAKGILIYLLAKPADWEVYAADVVKHAIDGRDAVYSGLNELIAAGYIVRTDVRGEAGKFCGKIYEVHEIPGKPLKKRASTAYGKSAYGKTVSGKSDTTNNDSTYIDSTNPPPPPASKEEEGVKKKRNPTVIALPTPFSAADPGSQTRLIRGCAGKGIDPVQLCTATAWEYAQAGHHMRDPIGAAIGKLTGGEAAETIAAWCQAQAITKGKKAVDTVRRQAEQAEEKQALEKRAWHREQARAAYRAFTSAPAPGGRP